MEERMNLLLRDLERTIRESLVLGDGMTIPILKSAWESYLPHRNIYRVLQTEEGRRLFSLAADEAHRISEMNSDFENFTELLHLLPRLSGTAYFRYAVAALHTFSGCQGSIDPTEAEAFWTEANRRLAGIKTDDAYRSVSVTAIEPLLYPDTDLLRDYASIDAYASYVAQVLASSDAMRIDLNALRFQRPDPYHAECGFRAARSGDATAQSRVWLASQLLRIAGEVCKKQGIVWILSGCSSADTEEMLAYLERNDRLPRVMLSVSLESTDAVESALVCAEEHRVLEKCIGVLLCGMLSAPMQRLHEAFRRLTERYPIGNLVYLPAGKTVEENLIEHTQLLHLLSGFLAEAVYVGDCTDRDTAVSIGRDILFGNVERMLP